MLLVVSFYDAVTLVYGTVFDASTPPYKATGKCRLQLRQTRSSKRGVRTVEESLEKMNARQNGL